MRGPNITERAIIICRKSRRCTRASIMFWLKTSISTSYGLWSFLRKACIEGLLDTDNLRCKYDEEGDEIVFEEVVRRE
jgi:hypothetical protein